MSHAIPCMLALSLAAVPAWPQFAPPEIKAAEDDPAAFALDDKSLLVERIGSSSEPAEAPPPGGNAGVDAGIILGSIINGGSRLWKVVSDNKPAVDVSARYAAALPAGTRGWASMEGWRPPKGDVYALTAKNLYGITVINVRYQVLRTYGGSFHGRGKYLTAVTIEPSLVEVAWGYRLEMDALVPDEGVVNTGTTDDPVAAMTIQLAWRVRTPIKDSQGRRLYFLQGDGSLRAINGNATIGP